MITINLITMLEIEPKIVSPHDIFRKVAEVYPNADCKISNNILYIDADKSDAKKPDLIMSLSEV
jgi:hypothetical protein